MDILSPRRNRTPLDRVRRALLVLATVLVILPLASLARHSGNTTDDVSPADRAELVACLTGFYDALNAGEEYNIVEYKYLASGYFEPGDMTLETMDRSAWDAVFKNTMRIMTEEGLIGPLTARARVRSIRREDNRYVMTLESELVSPKYTVEQVVEDGDRVGIEFARGSDGEPLPAEETRILKSHEQIVRFEKEDGSWKIAEYGDGLTIRRMDTDNPYGPIYLVWVENMGAEITPYGSMISKVIPAQYRPFNNAGISFVLED